MKTIRNGSIYFNTNTNRLERALAKFNTNKVWTSRHGSYPEIVKNENLRMATKEEVDSYFEEIKSKDLVVA